MRRRLGLLALLLPLLGVGTAGPAGATTYAYWSYWHKAPGSTSWTYSNSGPYYYRPADGSVEGWHFVTGSGGPSDPPPRASGSYATLCSTPKSNPGLQVALIIDFDSSVQRACLTVPSGSSGSTVLTKAGTNPHYNSSGLLCSIEGYPKSGCGSVVSSPAPTPAATRPAPHPTSAPTHAAAGRSTGASARAGSGTSAGPAVTGTTTGTLAATKSTAAAKVAASAAASSAAASSAAARAAAASPASASAGIDSESFAPVAARRGADGGSPMGLVAGGLAIAAVGAAAALRARRRS